MATELMVTDGVVRITANGAIQALYQAVDVSRFDQVDLLIWLNGLEGTVTSVTVSILTGMSLESEDGWVTINSFAALTTANTADKKAFTGVLKYIRWKVTAVTGTGAASFNIRGMARNN